MLLSNERRMVVRALRAAAASLSATKQKLQVFDCDETLIVSKGSVKVEKANGEIVNMDSATFAHFKPVPGDKLDFGAFNHVRNPRKIKATFEKFKKSIEDGNKVVILTARAKGAESAIKKFLKSEGVDLDKVDVVGLASSNPYDKARWIDKAIEDGGYDDVEFYDDSHANANAVAEHGKKLHSDIKFISTNVPHPKEEDYEGPASNEEFISDAPVAAVVEYKPKAGTPDQPSTHTSWWEKQTDTFKEKYCGEHGASKYC